MIDKQSDKLPIWVELSSKEIDSFADRSTPSTETGGMNYLVFYKLVSEALRLKNSK